MQDIVTIILAGGQGTRLYPLTQKRSKPAVPIGGRFRLIDIPISNCLHSNLKKIFLLTQFASESLHRHIFLTYRFDNFSSDFVTILTAQQTLETHDWYQGTADAVRKNMNFFRKRGDLVLILSGDHLYRMDYRKFIDFHMSRNADITISVYPISESNVSDYGVMKVNDDGFVTDFCEKPKEKTEIEKMRVSDEPFKHFGIQRGERTHLASMGIYLFKWDVLNELLENSTFGDFGREVIPFAIKQKRVFGYFFDGFWEDIGTIRTFFDTHIDLTQPLPKFNFYDESKPIYTLARFLPGSKILSSEVHHSILCEGSIINRSKIVHSIVGIRSRIGENCTVERAILLGADYFESKDELLQNTANQIPSIGIGNDCEIKNAIIDKNSRIGNGVKLVNIRNVKDEVTDDYVIRDGIIVIPKNAVIKDGTII